MTRRSLRARLVISVVIVTAAVLSALAALLYVGVHRAAWRQHDDALAARARALAGIAEHEDNGYEMILPPDQDAYVEVWTPDGQVLVQSQTLGAMQLPKQTGYFDVTLPGGARGRAIGMRFVTALDAKQATPPEMMLVLALGTDDVDAAIASVRLWFVALGLSALLAIAAITAWSVGRGLAPLQTLARDLEQIDDRNLATRLPVAGQPAELEVPVAKLNELLARLDSSFARERELTSNVSHELRTPLAGLRTMLEVSALAERSSATYRETIAQALSIVVQLTTMVENLLTLARLDAGESAQMMHDVPLRALVDDCWRPHAALAQSRSLELRNAIPADAIARSDREQLRIVIGNLLANAAEYTAEGGWIEVTTGGDAIVDVTDSGPPVEHPERIFERLWRGDASRTGTGVHCGIGLSLARSLCTRLGLAIAAANQPDGSVRFRVTRTAT